MGWRGPLTHRQFLTWQHWLLEDWNRPSRTDNYLMQVADQVFRGRLSKPAPNVNHETWKLKFETKADVPLTPTERDAMSREWWGALTGYEIPLETGSHELNGDAGG